MTNYDIQLEMNFSERQNRFRKTVGDGRFSLLIEGPVPGPQIPPQEAVKTLKHLEETVLGITGIDCGLAILDRNSNQEAWSAIEFAAHLDPASRDRHVVYLSGRNKSMKEIDRQLAIAANAGNINVVAVSGILDNSPERSDSGEIFKRLAQHKNFFPGITINPYQYDPWALMAQYSKIPARFATDTPTPGFFVTQMGWDTLKLQSLSWYLLSNSVFVPGFVRLFYLPPERLQYTLNNTDPGIIITKEFRKILEDEYVTGDPQSACPGPLQDFECRRKAFSAAQLRRLKLQAAAARLLGFSGIQLCGADHPQTALLAVQAIKQALEEFKTFEDFLPVYQSELADVEISSLSLSYQLFDRFFHRPYSFDKPPYPRELPDPEVSFWEKLFAKFAPKDALSPRRQGLPTVRLCPKHKSCGPCGGVRVDGKCENGARECVYRKWFRFAAAKDGLFGIEKELY